jgi:hypothetical protein
MTIEYPITATVYLVRLPDGSLYASGPRHKGALEGGPVAYGERSAAEKIAGQNSGQLVCTVLADALRTCRERHVVLYLVDGDGRTYACNSTATRPNPKGNPDLVPLDGKPFPTAALLDPAHLVRTRSNT